MEVPVGDRGAARDELAAAIGPAPVRVAHVSHGLAVAHLDLPD